MAEIRDITMDQGTTFNPAFIVRNPDKSFFDFGGYSARMQVRRSFNDTEKVLDLSTTNGKLAFQANGRIQLLLVPSDTVGIEFDGDELDGVYDIEVESAVGVVTRIAMGSFRITREVTR